MVMIDMKAKRGSVLFLLKKKCFIVDCWNQNKNNNNKNKTRAEAHQQQRSKHNKTKNRVSFLELSKKYVDIHGVVLLTGEVGVYITVYDATAANPKAYGSEHFYFMELMEKLHEELSKGNFVKMRAALEQKGEFKGAYIERFEKGNHKVQSYSIPSISFLN